MSRDGAAVGSERTSSNGIVFGMRTNVTFIHPAEFRGCEPYDGGVLAVQGADWFAQLLRRTPGVQLEDEPCQEDWGVVFFVHRHSSKFWIGLSAWDTDGAWNAHFHHGSFTLLQRFSSQGKESLRQLLVDFHAVLAGESAVSDIAWYAEREMSKPAPNGFSVPVDDRTSV